MKALMKRVVAYLLVTALVVSTVPVGFASAAENSTTEPENSTAVSTEELGFTISFDDVETYYERGGWEEEGFFHYDGYRYPSYTVTPVSEEFSIEQYETYFDIYRDGEYNCFFEFEFIPEEEQSAANPWGPGAHKILVNLVWNNGEQRLDNVGSYDYIIKEIPISGLYFEDTTLTEHTGGEVIQEEGGESWYKYTVNQFSYGFVYDDQECYRSNKSEEYEPGFYLEEEDVWYYPTFTTNQSAENVWTPDNDNCVVTAHFGGHTANFNVVIEANPITGISFTKDSYDVIEGTCQEEKWDWIETEEYSEEISWRGYNPREFAELEVFLANGESLVLSGWQGLPSGEGEEGEEYEGEHIYPWYETNETYDKQWNTETTDAKIYAELLGYKAEASVNIVETPIESISVTPEKIMENTRGDWQYPEVGEKYWVYYPNYTWKEAELVFKDGTEQTIVREDFEDESYIRYEGKRYPVKINGYQNDENRWTVDGENAATMEVAGFVAEYNVVITENPIDKIEVNPMSIVKGTNQYMSSGEAYNEETEEWYEYEYLKYDEEFWRPAYTVYLKDNSVINIQGGRGFEYDGQYYYPQISSDQSYENQWDAVGEYTGIFTLMGVEAEFTVNIIETIIEDITVETKDLMENNDGRLYHDEDGEFYKYYVDRAWERFTIHFKEELNLEDQVFEREDLWDEEARVTYDGQNYYVKIKDSQSYSNQWTVGGENTATIEVAGFTKEFNVTILECPIESIEVEPVSIIEGTKQCTDYDVIWDEDSEDGREVEYTKYDENYWEPAYTVTMKDGCEIDGEKVLHFEGGDGFYYNGERHYPSITSDQSYTNVWDEPGAYNATFSLLGAEVEFTVNITKLTVESITINDGDPVQLAANIDGYMTYVDDEDGEHQYFYYSESRMVKNYSVVIDGKTYYSSEDGDIRYEGGWYQPTIKTTQSYENQWKAGETYEVEFTLFGKTETFNVEIVDTVVGDIIVNEGETVELIANIDGYMNEDEYIDEGEGEDEGEYIVESYFHYRESMMVKSYSVVVNGETYQSDRDGYITVNGRKYEPDVSTNQSYDNPWKVGRTYRVNFKILGETVTFPVKIIDTPVDEIIVNDGKTIELLANTDGYKEYDEETDGNSYFRYSESRMIDDLYVVIDGKTYRSDNEYGDILYNGRHYDYDINSNQSFDNQWEAGKTYDVEVSIMGKTTTFPVKIKEIPIGKITINGQEEPILKVIENTYGERFGEDEESPYFHYYVEDLIHQFTVEIDGKTYESDKYGFIKYNDREYTFDISSKQNGNAPWEAGETYEAEFSFMGASKTINVEILENPIDSIVVEDMSIPVLTNGYYDYDYDEEAGEEVRFYRYDFNRYPPDYTITLKDGFTQNGEKTITVRADEAFVYEGREYQPNFYAKQSYKNQWSTEGPNTVTVNLGGATTTFNVTLVEELPFTVEFNDMTVVEKTNGYYLDEDINKYEYSIVNDDYIVKDGDGNELTVEKTDKGVDGKGFFYDGRFYPIYFDSQQSDEPFEKGKENIVTCKIGSEEFFYQMNIVDTKVTSVKINDVTMEANTYDEYSLWDQDIAIVVTIDGETRVVHSNNETFGFKHNDDWYDIDYFEYQFDYDKDEWIGWGLGLNKASVIIGGVKTDFNVRIVCANDAHDYDEGVVTVEPTCDATGEKTFTCEDCGVTKAESVDKTNHTPGEAATCTTAQKCTVCQTELKAATGHTPGAEATCTTAQKCTVCQTELKAATGHTPGAEATCTTAQKCTVCQTELKAATGHTPGAEATCTTAQKCTVCQTELKAATGHDWEEATCTTPKTCKVCAVTEGTTKPHTEELIPGKAATLEAAGLTEGKKCSVCGTVTVTQETIAAIDTVKLSYDKKVYTGKTLAAPKLTVTDTAGKALVSGTDYTVTGLTGKKSVGRYKVTVTFRGSYAGSTDLYFNIVPKKTSSAKAVLCGYDDIKFSWSKVTGASGYLVSYKKGSGSWSKAVATTGTSYKKANLSDGVKYTFKVVPYYKTKTSTVKYYDANQYKTAYAYTLKKVSGVKVAKSGTKVKVSWSNISGETGYQISKMTSKKATQKKPLTYKTTTGKYKKLSATKGKTYYYKVRAYKEVSGEKIYGPWSTVKAYKRK